MKIQGLAVIAMIIIIPMSILLNSYATSQIKTLQFQISYDSKLKNSTYDGIKALQLNMANSTTSDLANSKMRDIKAAIKTFYGSLASNFEMAGYGEDVLRNYVPAIVYTLYDGYYIYSEYTNQLGDDITIRPDSTYNEEDEIYGLKPYIYYSCRYKGYPYTESDFVITYSLDSYITIQGKINNSTYVNESGYLLTGVSKSGEDIKYKGVKIKEESGDNLKQKIYVEEETSSTNPQEGTLYEFPQRKVNGVKYYYDESNNNVFSMVNDTKLDVTKGDDGNPTVNTESIKNNTDGKRYYEDALEFKQKISNLRLNGLSSSNAVDANGTFYIDYPEGTESPYTENIDIFEELFDTSGKYIEDENSNFNVHKTEVIKNAIESNLMVAIENYNKVSSVGVNFAMPKLKDSEWEDITHGISMITFLQGLNIGGKIYNGYAIVQNNVNEDFVSENSIYIADDQKYYRVTDTIFDTNSSILNNAVGVINIDFERKTVVDVYKKNGLEEKKNIYYYPREQLASYTSVVNLNGAGNNKGSISEYFSEVGSASEGSTKYRLAQIYYTALGRERHGMYRVMNKLEKIQEELLN